MKILFFDTETIGLPKRWDAPVTDTDNWPRVMQLAWELHELKVGGFERVKEYQSLIQPEGWEVPKQKFWLDHGYSTEKSLREGRPLTEVLELFLADHAECNVLVGHNIKFDLHTLGAELIRLGVRGTHRPHKICTMLASTEFCALPRNKWPRLEELYSILFGENLEGAHAADVDVAGTARCFFELVRRKVISLPEES